MTPRQILIAVIIVALAIGLALAVWNLNAEHVRRYGTTYDQIMEMKNNPDIAREAREEAPSLREFIEDQEEAGS